MNIGLRQLVDPPVLDAPNDVLVFLDKRGTRMLCGDSDR
jgi:hypothetical protein